MKPGLRVLADAAEATMQESGPLLGHKETPP